MTLDLARSRLMGPPPRRLLMKIAHEGDALRYDGDRVVTETTYDGREFRDYWSLSADGRALTMTHVDDLLAGQMTVLQRRS